MDLATRKYNFIQQLFEVDEDLFNKLEQVLEVKKTSKPIPLNQYNDELNEANARIENGAFYTIDEAEKMASQW